MSSTPGIGMSIDTAGIDSATTGFVWTERYGPFLLKSPPDYAVKELGDTVTNPGETLYWSLTDKPSSSESPVVVTVVAWDPAGF